MNTIELAARVVETSTAHSFRVVPGEGIQAKPWGTGQRWTVLDLFSASAIVAVAEKLSDENRAKLARLHPVKAARVCLSLCK